MKWRFVFFMNNYSNPSLCFVIKIRRNSNPLLDLVTFLWHTLFGTVIKKLAI